MDATVEATIAAPGFRVTLPQAEPPAVPKPESTVLLEAARFARSMIPNGFRPDATAETFDLHVGADGTAEHGWIAADDLSSIGTYAVLNEFARICEQKAANLDYHTEDAKLVFLADSLLGMQFQLKKGGEFGIVRFAQSPAFERADAYALILQERLGGLARNLQKITLEVRRNIEAEIARLQEVRRDIEAEISRLQETAGAGIIKERDAALARIEKLRAEIDALPGEERKIADKMALVRLQIGNIDARPKENCETAVAANRHFGAALRARAVLALGFVKGEAEGRAAELAVRRMFDEETVMAGARISVLKLGIHSLSPLREAFVHTGQIKAEHQHEMLVGLMEEACLRTRALNGHRNAEIEVRRTEALVTEYKRAQQNFAKRAEMQQERADRNALIAAARMAATSGFWGWRNAFMRRIQHMELEHWKRADAKKGKIACRN